MTMIDSSIHEATTSEHDQLSRFLLDEAGVRGVHVRLRETWNEVRGRVDYPQAVSEMLGEALVASALFTGHTKVEGRLSVQLRSDTRLRTLFAECTAAGTLRGIAQLAEGDSTAVARDLTALGDNAVLAITIENPTSGGREPVRYQGIVALASDSLAGAFEQYFLQSEQLPTRLLLAVDGDNAAGLMLQKLPGDVGDADGWNRCSTLFDTLTARELLELPAETLLARLFHEDSPRLLGTRQLAFGCSCSRARVASMLESLGREEAAAAVIDGQASIRCEFCGQGYHFSPTDIDALFTQERRPMAAPDLLQ